MITQLMLLEEVHRRQSRGVKGGPYYHQTKIVGLPPPPCFDAEKHFYGCI